MAASSKVKNMLTEIKLQQSEAGHTVISISVPSAKASAVAETIRGILQLAGHKVRCVNEEGAAIYYLDEVFPDSSPAAILRGYRGKMEWTQQELAERLGITRNRISDMENGRKRISLNMARRLSELFNIPYKVFL